MQLILASGSPRRRELLSSAGLTFRVQVPEVDETPLPGETPRDTVLRLAALKAATVSRLEPEALVLAADTTVVLGDRMLEKPRHAAEARAMLEALSGNTHQVLTAFALHQGDRQHAAVCTTTVRFRQLTPGEIGTYVDSGEPMDKAGAYGIQGRAAGFVLQLDGSYTNVVGLPLAQVIDVMRDFSR